jgi:hypothetical protein
MSLSDYFDEDAGEGPDHVATPNDELADVDGIKNERNVIIYGGVQSGEWEAVLMECHKEVKVWNVSAGAQPSLETVQLQEAAVADVLSQLSAATKVFVLPEEQTGFSGYEELAAAAMASPEDTLVVLPEGRPDRSKLHTQLTDSGAVVVATMEDAALYIACAV